MRELYTLTTHFPKKAYGTWWHPRSRLPHQIDHVITSLRDRKCFLDAGSRLGQLIDSDHKPVACKLRLVVRAWPLKAGAAAVALRGTHFRDGMASNEGCAAGANSFGARARRRRRVTARFMPTPAVAMLTRSLRADLGVMISASHNPFEDNGIKLFGPDGYKLSDSVEFEIEAKMDSDLAAELEPSDMLGRARRLEDARGRYTEYVKQTFPRGLRLDGFKIALDCANGAAYKVAPEVLWELGAEITTIGVTPDGTNINKNCGSTHLDALQSQTVAAGADIGLALDGDADRLIVCDQNGRVIDGDQIMALIAKMDPQLSKVPDIAYAVTSLVHARMKQVASDRVETLGHAVLTVRGVTVGEVFGVGSVQVLLKF